MRQIDPPPSVPLYNPERRAVTVTYNNGLYTPAAQPNVGIPAQTQAAVAPVAAASSASPAADQIYSSAEVASVVTETVPYVAATNEAAMTSSAAAVASSILASTSAVTDSALASSSVLSDAPPSTVVMSSPSDFPTLTSASPSAPSSSPTTGPSPTSKDASVKQEDNKDGIHITVKQLIPLFAILGAVLVLAVIGKIWGSFAHRGAVAARKKRQQERQLLQDHRREQKRERQEMIRRQWEVNGWGEMQSPDNSFEKQTVAGDEYHNIRGGGEGGAVDDRYDDYYEDEVKSRVEGDMYDTKVQTTPWLQVQWQRLFGRSEENQAHYGAYSTPLSEEDRQKGTWGRIKESLTSTTGWGYDGTSPSVPQRRQMMGGGDDVGAATRALLYGDALQHTPAGMLMPPRLDDDGDPIVHQNQYQPGTHTAFALARQRGGDAPDSPPELTAPQNTVRTIPPSSSSKMNFTNVKNVFSVFQTSKSRSNESFADVIGSMKHARDQDLHGAEVVEDRHPKKSRGQLFGHQHAPGSVCSLDEPQYLPPPSARKREESKQSEAVVGTTRYMAAVPQSSTPLKRVCTQLQVKEAPEQAHRVDQRLAIPVESVDYDSMYTKSSVVTVDDEDMDELLPGDGASTVYSNCESAKEPLLLKGEMGEEEDVFDEEEDERIIFKAPSRSKTVSKKISIDMQVVRGYKSLAERSDQALDGVEEEEDDSSTKKRLQRSDASRSSSTKSSRSYTQPVNFDDEGIRASRRPRKISRSKTDGQQHRSKHLTRASTRKNPSMSTVSEVQNGREEGDSEDHRSISSSRDHSASSHSTAPPRYQERQQPPSDTARQQTTASLLQMVDSMKRKVDDNADDTSHSRHDRAKVARASTLDSSVYSSPGRKSAWRERNGKWERAADGEEEESDWNSSPRSKYYSPQHISQLPPAASPPPLSPHRITSPVSSTVRGRAGQTTSSFSSPTRPLALHRLNSLKSPSIYSAVSASSEGEDKREASSAAPSYRSTASPPKSPLHNIPAAKPPRRYQAKLRDEEDIVSTSTYQPRLHTGKSIRTPAEIERERQFAMDRVQSIVTKGHAKRQQSN